MSTVLRLAANLVAIFIFGLTSLLAACGGEGSGDLESSGAVARPQGVSIRATVIDETGAPVAGAAVTLSGSAEKGHTDANGNILLNVAPGDYVLTITSGSATVSIPVAAGDVASVELGRIQLASAASGVASGPLVGLGSSDFDCGGYQQRNCKVDDWEYLFGGFGLYQSCDRGLKCGSDWEFCLIGEGVCRNDKRWQDRAKQVRQGWAYGALAEQRKIARFEPLNWTAIIAAHNAFNNEADGYVLKPNQQNSMTDQLQMGARGLLLDVHHVCGGLYKPFYTCEIRLSHASYETVLGVEVQLGASPGDRHFGFGMKEIAQWLERNPGEVIVLHMEEYLEDKYADAESRADYAWSFEHFLGPYLLRHSEKKAGRWPTLAEMRSMVPPRQVIAFGSALPEKDYLFHGSPGQFTNPWKASLPKNFDPGACTVDGTTDDGTYYRFELSNPGQTFVGIEESRYILGGASGYESSGVIAEDCTGSRYPCAAAAAIAACGNAEVALDFVGDDVVDDNVAIGDRMGGLVWSWKRDERGWEKDGNAALLEAASGRWVAREPTENHAYACGHWREGEPLTDWKDTGQLTEWRITQGRGPYAKGGLQCAREFGSEFVFSVPVNGPQNTALRDALAATEAGVWLAYRDVKAASGEIYWDRDVPCVTGVVARPSEPWPPNHKMAIVQLEVVHRCVQAPLCRITRVTSDDPAATAEDWRVTADMTVELRAERSGSSRDGRTYSVDVECVVDEAGRLNWTAVDVLVPHDQGSN